MSALTSYAESAIKAKTHARGFAQSLFGDHPVTAAILVAVLIIIIFVLAFFLVAANSKANSDSMSTLGFASQGAGDTSGALLGVRDGMTTSYEDRSLKCGPGERVTPMPATVNDDGTVTAGGVYCAPESYAVDPKNLGCGRPWDPKAKEEVSALYELVGLEGSPGGDEFRFRHAIDESQDGQRAF